MTSKVTNISRTSKNLSLHKYAKKETDYEKMIHSFLLNKYLALSSMNYLDIEYDRLMKEEEEKKVIFRQAAKKKFNITKNLKVKSGHITTVHKNSHKIRYSVETLNPNILYVPTSDLRVGKYIRTFSK